MALPLKPWHQVVIPREDLRKGQPLDAAEFAIHLDQVMDGRAPDDYKKPERFWARTYLTKVFIKMTVEVMQRLAGQTVGTSQGINFTTQFGGGKTHFLTLLYHLCRAGDAAKAWPGVPELLALAQLDTVPQARVATFIGNRFDFVVGVGAPGEPKRLTPWGDLAWQIGQAELFALFEKHDQEGVVPGGEHLQKIFSEKPTLILMDEVLSFIRRAREEGGKYARLGSQFYSFLDVLTREVAGCTNAVLVVSLPLSRYEMTQEDETEYQRLDNLMDRLSKPVLLSEQLEIAEIVRRRLFEPLEASQKEEMRQTAEAYAEWLAARRKQLPDWFPVDQAVQQLEASYPFHPSVLAVFERKWQAHPRFQRTRAILRLLALWVSRAFQDAFTTGRKDPLLSLGSAPLDESLLRAAALEQLGEQKLEAAIMADIAGPEANALSLDAEAADVIKNLRLHQKVATTIFFESSGGQLRNEATLPEIRLAVGEPGLDVGNIETVLDDLIRQCYYLDVKGAKYWISHRPNLNKIIADRAAAISGPEGTEAIRERVRENIRKVFLAPPKLEKRFFVETSGDIPNVPALALVILSPELNGESSLRQATRALVNSMIMDYGAQGRTYKSGLLFAVPESGAALADEARWVLAIESLEDPTEQQRLKIDASQVVELREKKRRSDRELKDKVWRTYRHLWFLGEDGGLQELDLGLLHPSMADSLVGLIIARLKQEGVIEDSINADFLVRNWPTALTEWSTKAVRDTFFASPKFPRLLNPEVLRTTIVQGVNTGKFGYVSKKADGSYEGPPLIDDPDFGLGDVEFSDQVALLPRDEALKVKADVSYKPQQATGAALPADESVPYTTQVARGTPPPITSIEVPKVPGLRWEGEVPSQKWTNFYMKVLTGFATEKSLKIRLEISVKPEDGVTLQKIDDIKMALRDLGLSDEVDTE
jgi:hypothetical protein